MKFTIDMNEMEQQRYNHIKKSGKYIELNILIGCEDEKFDGKIGKLPVVTTCMHGAGSTEVMCMYQILGLLREHLEEEYPAECILSKIATNVSYEGHIETPVEGHERRERKKEE